jgi:threonine aldolase
MQNAVNFVSDGLGLTPPEFAEVLLRCTQVDQIQLDSYALGGMVEQVEQKFADLLGKQQAVFMPTGTMANHIALRELAGGQGKVIVQAESHIYRDIGDGPQTLSNLNLIPLAPKRAAFTLAEVEQVVQSLLVERVATHVRVISIESPVRRLDDAMFGFEEMTKIAAYARQQGIKMHLDGARLFVEAAHTGADPAEYATHFDTVFVSLSKCFNCASGAVLAGPASVMEDVYHTRRMFGGSLPQAWPQAAVALHFADTFLPAYRSAWPIAEALFLALDADEGFRVERIPNGTHIVRLHVPGKNLDHFRGLLHAHQVHLPPVDEDGESFRLKVNPSANHTSAENLVQAFRAAHTASDAS